MQDAYKKIVEKVEAIERQHGSLEDFVLTSTIFEGEHKMRTRGETLSEIYAQTGTQDFFDFRNPILLRELEELELADLWDLKMQSGRFDGEHI